ncbi:MAG TPA: putative lipid II flippase FtsW [Candidatus Dormibacteraeota bacterium]|jgi:cell division protein FtsW|nr:putative lipid II flippase FtsW [Candidatus Dormibacteraeota bacterium]
MSAHSTNQRAGSPAIVVRPVDRSLVVITLCLITAGLIMVLSSSQALAYVYYNSALYFFERQAVGMALGVIAMVVICRMDLTRLRSWARPVAAALMLFSLLVAVPHLGIKVNGAQRWFALGPLGTFQPSEFAKLGYSLFMADWLVRRGERLRSLEQGFLPFLVLVALGIAPLLLLQHDLGTTLVMSTIFVAAFLAAGGRFLHLGVLALLVIAALAAVTVVSPYRMARFASFRNPLADPLGTGFQSTQAIYALGSGGPLGVGLGHSVEKFLWLPEAHTDFIFAIVGEETGLWGTTGLLLLFLAFAIRGYRIALKSRDRFCMVAATSITTWIVFQALLNMGGVSDTLPIAGVPMPFVSYGGTAVASVLAAVGILLAISRRTDDPSYTTKETIDEASDSGGRDGRTPVTRPRRRAGATS